MIVGGVAAVAIVSVRNIQEKNITKRYKIKYAFQTRLVSSGSKCYFCPLVAQKGHDDDRDNT